jgi:hypothetical protein
MKHLNLLPPLITLAWYVANPSYITCIGMLIALAFYVVSEKELSQEQTKSQFESLNQKIQDLNQRFGSIHDLAEETKKHLTAANMAAGFKIGK